MSVYLDYNASTPIDERVLEKIISVYRNNIGNADSRTHDYGEGARKIVEDARNKVASLLSITKGEVFFTSGATESVNIAIQGLRKYGLENKKNHIITSSIEHKAVLETSKAMKEFDFEVDFVEPDISGRISVNEVISLVKDNTLLVSIMHVNNETGIIQPVKEIGDYLEDKAVYFHVDATQSFGKLVDELRDIKYDMLSMSAHKIYGPQGIGALILRKKRYKLPPVKNIMYGGEQEHGIRPGTLPVALIAGFGKACELAEREYKSNHTKSVQIKREIMYLLNKYQIDYSINGDSKYCVDYTINLCIKGVSSEALMLSTKQFCGVSNGSACNSKSYSLSYVLVAMGIPEEDIQSSIRISWGYGVNQDEVYDGIKQLLAKVKELVG